MNDQVEQIKSKVDIVEIIGERVVLKKAGRHFKGLCPFHSEKSPSFIVSAERQSFKCFGCQEGGDVLSFLQKYEGMSFLESLEMLAKRVGITLESYRPTTQDSYKKKLLSIMSLASEYYHFILTNHKSGEEARQYLKSRGIGSEAINQFNLGYAPNQWRSVSDFLITKKQFLQDEVEAVGLIIKSEKGHYDRFRGRVMFPLKDHKGVVVGFSGRTLLKDEKEAKYINSPETMLYSKSKMLYGLYENREYIRKENEVVLVEGELDMIPSWQAGVKNVVAIKGSAFTEQQAQLISRFTKYIVMSLDSDTAGEEAIKRAVIMAENLDMSIKVVRIVGGKDPGDVATGSMAKWREMVKHAVSYWDFLIDSVCNRTDPSTGNGAKQIAQEIVPAISQISNSIVRSHYVSELSKRLKVPEESIYSEIEKADKKRKFNLVKQDVEEIKDGKRNRREEVEKYLLALALEYFDENKVNFEKVKLDWFSILSIAKIFDRLMTFDSKEKFDIKVFASSLPSELHETLNDSFLIDVSRVSDHAKEWNKVVADLRSMYITSQSQLLSKQIIDLEKSGASTDQLQAKLADLYKE